MSTVKKLARRLVPTRLRRAVGTRHATDVENIFHCCVHKTASQWVRKILADERTYKYSGLEAYNYQRDWPGGVDTRPITERKFTEPFPTHTIVTPIYIDLPG